MDIKKEQIASKKIIGKHKGNPVYELVTKGGLNMIVIQKSDGSAEFLGAAAHQAVSQYIAEGKYKDIEWTELSKSEGIPPLVLKEIAKEWEELNKLLIPYISQFSKQKLLDMK